jgi:hypothetical protein
MVSRTHTHTYTQKQSLPCCCIMQTFKTSKTVGGIHYRFA